MNLSADAGDYPGIGIYISRKVQYLSAKTVAFRGPEEGFGVYKCENIKNYPPIQMYEQNGIYEGENLLLTYETSKTPINPKAILRNIQRYLK